jgi:hypothetical protein
MIHVSTRQYEFSHGKLPRGRGYWAFFFDGETEAFWSTPNTLYRVAINDAKRYAVSKGYSTIEVGS